MHSAYQPQLMPPAGLLRAAHVCVAVTHKSCFVFFALVRDFIHYMIQKRVSYVFELQLSGH